jgi:hypothetical protein
MKPFAAKMKTSDDILEVTVIQIQTQAVPTAPAGGRLIQNAGSPAMMTLQFVGIACCLTEDGKVVMCNCTDLYDTEMRFG